MWKHGLIIGIVAALSVSAIAGGIDPTTCHAQCMAGACKRECAPDNEDAPAQCKPCLEAYDRVCTEQCKPRPKPTPPPVSR